MSRRAITSVVAAILTSLMPLFDATQSSGGGGQTFQATGRIVRVPGDDSNPPCFISVDAWQPGTWSEQVYDTQLTAEGWPYATPAGTRLKEGQPDRSTEAQADVDRVVYALETALAFSEDMRTKVRDACTQLGSWINVRVVRNDPAVEGGMYRIGTNTAFLDLGDLDAEQYIPGLTVEDNPEGPVASRLAKSQNIRTTLAHEIDHMRGPSHDDPIPEESNIFLGLAGVDENRVMDDLGFPLRRLEYSVSDSVRYRAFGTIVYLKTPTHVSANSDGEAHRFEPGALDAIGNLRLDGSNADRLADDKDQDGIPDAVDTCPALMNSAQWAVCSSSPLSDAAVSSAAAAQQPRGNAWTIVRQDRAIASGTPLNSGMTPRLILGADSRVSSKVYGPATQASLDLGTMEYSSFASASNLTTKRIASAARQTGQTQIVVPKEPPPTILPSKRGLRPPWIGDSRTMPRWPPLLEATGGRARTLASMVSAGPFSLRPPSWKAQSPDLAAPAFQPSAKIFFTSLGRSTGDAVEMTVVNDGNVPIQVTSDGFALQPIAGVTAQDLERELKAQGLPQVTIAARAYCLDFNMPVPAAGTVMRLADSPPHGDLAHMQHMLSIVRRLVDARALRPDVDDELYVDSIRQWALWTMEERFTERTFTTAFIEHTRKNLEASGDRWRREFDKEARELAASRWRDVQRVLSESARTGR